MFRYILPVLLLLSIEIYAQQPDTVKRLEEVRVTGYLGNQELLRSTGGVSVVNSRQLQVQSGNSMVSVLNTLPGVRMEERSPGSYRLSVRGSLLRSPFGVRNLKVYLDELPLTDAGGNTYLNAINVNALNGMEVLKGPDGSLFGANSGGVLILKTGLADSLSLKAGFNAGSFGSFGPYATYRQQAGKHQLTIHQSYQQGKGYRNHSAMDRTYTQISDTWKYSGQNELSVLGFYSNLHYQTPGGLNLVQFQTNPRLARQPTATLPGAEQQKAGIYTRMFFGGITHRMDLSPKIRHVFSVFGSSVDFRNPFITNYEQRDEGSLGLRTYFVLADESSERTTRMTYHLGSEWQCGKARIDNYDNLGGQRGALQAANTIESGQFFLFGRARADINREFIVEGSLSLNDNRYIFKDQSGVKIKFDPQLMPRLALNWKAAPDLAVRAVLSRGYSVPTTAEVRPSDNSIYEDLQPENGWNYETGIRTGIFNNRLDIDLAAFYYRLSNAIVRQVNTVGAEYFINAGGTSQKGLEMALTYKFIRPADGTSFLKALEFSNSYTLSNFRFKEYLVAGQDFSGKRLTGVPRNMNTSQLYAAAVSAYLSVQYTYTGKLPLNDANSVFANTSHLVQVKTAWTPMLSLRSGIELFAGIDNLLDKRYSLGHDINALGSRFYNAAPGRNYFFGLSWRAAKKTGKA